MTELRQRITDASRAALAAAALQPLTTRVERVRDAGIDFVVHVLDRSAHKPPAGGAADPFLAPEPALLVADVSPTHRLLLNKFPVLDAHALIVTRAFEEQSSALTFADFDALRRCLAEIDGLAFYNAGRVAGASQRHKHLQLVPLPLIAGGPRLPIEPGVSAALPFRHASGRFSRRLPPAQEWLDAYRALRLALRLGDDGYNLLATREWIMLVPRPRETFEGLGANALGFAGVMLVHGDAELDTLRRVGPARVLKEISEG
jgi:ATP adenylyltransferase